MTESALVLAHGVGRVYESPIPVWLYALGAAATVLASFALRILVPEPAEARRERLVAGPGLARAVTIALRAGGLAGLALALVSGLAVRSEGFTATTLLFWVGLVVGMTALSAVLDGAWDAADPWATIERGYRLEEEPRRLDAPHFLGPLLLFGLFWFELVSRAGFEDFWVIAVLLAYSLFVFGFRSKLADDWRRIDPLSLLFGFAGRVAPCRLTPGGISYRGLAGLDGVEPMSAGPFAGLFVLLGATTLDNLRETVGWTNVKASLGLDALPPILLETIALAVFAVAFAAPFLLSVRLARRWAGSELRVPELARRFGWSLVPIGIAYLLAHNAPLLMTGVPALLRTLSDPFELGWNLLGTSNLLVGYVPSPAFVWFLEIVLIVGGHILGVLTAHRAATRLAPTQRRAVKSQYALTGLMAVFTIVTLWLLAQPLVI